MKLRADMTPELFNRFGAARSGTLESIARELTTNKTIALFRCTQMVLWPKEAKAGPSTLTAQSPTAEGTVPVTSATVTTGTAHR